MSFKKEFFKKSPIRHNMPEYGFKGSNSRISGLAASKHDDPTLTIPVDEKGNGIVELKVQVSIFLCRKVSLCFVLFTKEYEHMFPSLCYESINFVVVHDKVNRMPFLYHVICI